MDVYDAIKNRRSVRSFVQREVEFEKIVNILTAANNAPSAGNIQDWKFVVVYRRDMKEALAQCCPKQEWVAHAPVLIVVSANIEADEEMYGPRGKLFTVQNAACATQNLILASVAEGLGTCWVGGFVEDQVQKALAMPKNARPTAIIALGYYEETPVPLPKKAVDDVVFFHQWGNREKSFAKANSAYHTYVTDTLEKVQELFKK